MSVDLLCTTRNGIVERRERGHCVLSDAHGTILWQAGDPDHVTYLRSSAKPVQATALVLSGAMEQFGLQESHLAVACGSHNGEAGHVRAASGMLERAGVSPAALQCGSHEPYPPEALRLAQAGLRATPLQNNCSGKHAGMLVATKAQGAPLATYLALDHPVQQVIRSNMALCAGMRSEDLHVGIDGCSAPNFAMPMRHIARCFAQIARPTDIPMPLAEALQRIGRAMRAHPWMVDGTGELDTALMSQRATPIISKGGAEGLHCIALPALGLGLAIKVESGRAERMGSVAIAVLQALGIFGDQTPSELAPFDRPAVRNHRGILVGETQVLLDLSPLKQHAAQG